MQTTMRSVLPVFLAGLALLFDGSDVLAAVGRCDYWHAQVIPPEVKPTTPVVKSEPHKISSNLELTHSPEPLYSRLSEAEAFEAIDCLLMLEGNKNDSRIVGATRVDTSQTFGASSVEVAALYYVSVIFYRDWGHAGAAALVGQAVVGDRDVVVAAAYAAHKKWLVKVKQLGWETARAEKLDPLDGSGVRWY